MLRQPNISVGIIWPCLSVMSQNGRGSLSRLSIHALHFQARQKSGGDLAKDFRGPAGRRADDDRLAAVAAGADFREKRHLPEQPRAELLRGPRAAALAEERL